MILLDDCHHFAEVLFHTLGKFELCAAAVEIMVLPLRLKVGVSLKMIRKKSYSTLKRH
jgi:hypothetical protein